MLNLRYSATIAIEISDSMIVKKSSELYGKPESSIRDEMRLQARRRIEEEFGDRLAILPSVTITSCHMEYSNDLEALYIRYEGACIIHTSGSVHDEE